MKQLFEITCGLYPDRKFITKLLKRHKYSIEQRTDIGTWKCTFVFHQLFLRLRTMDIFLFKLNKRRPYAMEMLHRCNSGLIWNL